jgi:hypothetical protein
MTFRLASVMAVTAAACGGGGSGTTPGADARPPDFVEHATQSLPEIHLAAGDLDNDGDVDLYMISDPGGLGAGTSAQDKLARNDGTGTLVVEDGTTVDQDCSRPRLSKIDQDDYLDLVCLPVVFGGASARLNQAGASFVAAGYDATPVDAARAWPALPSSVVAATSSGLLALAIEPDGTQMTKTALAADSFSALAVADLDGDGVPELIAGTPTTWSVFSGADRSRRDYAGAPGELESADLNRDGRPDVLAISDGAVAISLASASGLSAPVVVSGPPSDADHFIVDYDGDGVSDLLFIGVGPQVYVMRGDGAGSLNAPEALLLDGAPLPTFMAGRNLSAVADFNGDGKIDLAISDVQTRTVRIWNGR